MSLDKDEKQAELAGKIPVTNIWWFYLYAFDYLKGLKKAKNFKAADLPDALPELLAEILIAETEHRLRQNLSIGYQSRSAEISRVRGRIDFLTTSRHSSLAKGKIACRFDELTADTPNNRFVRDALGKAADLIKKNTEKGTDKQKQQARVHKCRSLAGRLRANGVTGVRPERLSHNRLRQHEISDQRMLFAADLIFKLAFPENALGSNLHSPDEDDKAYRNLFEQAVKGFYRFHFGAAASKIMEWGIPETDKSGIKKFIPQMRTDITLDLAGRRIIIDTKFTDILSKESRRHDRKFKSAHLYQIYAYLRSQENFTENDDKDNAELNNNASGVLLYPKVKGGDEFLSYLEVKNHIICFATVDLAASPQEIKKRLLEIVGSLESIQIKKAA